MLTLAKPLTLYVLRHGNYIDLGSETVEQDKWNALSPEGRTQLHQAAAVFAAWKPRVDRILSSPFVRARQTAEIFADALNLPVSGHASLTRLEFDLKALERLIDEYSGVKTLLLVGHEPDLSRVVGELIGGAVLEIDRGGLVRIDVESLQPLTGRLIWLLPPLVFNTPATDTVTHSLSR